MRNEGVVFVFHIQEVFKCAVEVNVVRYIAAILDYIAADILKVRLPVHILILCGQVRIADSAVFTIALNW